MPAAWPQEKVNYLYDNWGVLSIPTLAKNLKVTEYAIFNKARREKLGRFLSSGEYITISEFFKAIGRFGSYTWTLQKWSKLDFPVKTKRVNNCTFKVVYLEDFWKWAKEYRMHVDFAKLEHLAIGEEPSWVQEQRKADQEHARFKVTPWTSKEDAQLQNYINAFRYTYKDISIMMLRTEGAIKRRITELQLTAWPLREPPHGIWSKEEIDTVINLYKKGYRAAAMKFYVSKSEQAIRGKIERLIKEGDLVKWK